MISVRLLPDCADRLDQPHRGIKRIVEAVPAVLEEDVAAHLAGQRRAGFLHLRLDEAVAGLPHQRLAAELGNAVEQRLARLHVGDDRRAGLLASRTGSARIISSWSPQITRPIAVHRADPVSVTVEGNPEVELLALDELL